MCRLSQAVRSATAAVMTANDSGPSRRAVRQAARGVSPGHVSNRRWRLEARTACTSPSGAHCFLRALLHRLGRCSRRLLKVRAYHNQSPLPQHRLWSGGLRQTEQRAGAGPSVLESLATAQTKSQKTSEQKVEEPTTLHPKAPHRQVRKRSHKHTMNHSASLMLKNTK